MINLQYFERSDFKQLIDWIESPEFLLQWAGPFFEFPLTEEQLEVYIEGTNQDNSSSYVYKVVDLNTGETIGHISLAQIDRRNKSARIGKVLVGSKSVRGQGIGQKMLEEILNIAFGKLNLHRVSLGVFDFNHSAIACYERVGFIKEGLLRDSRKMGNEYWSLWEMSILEDEWLCKKQKI
ncbi:GNAT family N-acetyltransferase [Cytobacillus sp. FJAT-54145]|uniref:GNAT family N-acetyltransferase n=1 Tax=Cytobacillus spartinae TaxID=3299023 RepID=A0ABW6KIW1_9BACI